MKKMVNEDNETQHENNQVSVSAKMTSENGCSTELELARQIIHKHSSFKLLKLQFEKKAIESGNSIKKRDKLKCELNSVKQTLDLNHQGCRDLKTRGLYHVEEAAEKDEITSLKNCIMAQKVQITELCTSNSEMSSKLEKVQLDLEASTAELEMLRDFKTKYNKSLEKTRELGKQSVSSMENKLEEIAAKSLNQLAEIRCNLQMELTKNKALEDDLKNKKDANYCHISEMNVALDLVQSELKDCQDQLGNLQSIIPSWDAEIKKLRVQLEMKTKQLEGFNSSEEVVKSLEERLERLRLENEQIKIQLNPAKSNLTETLENFLNKSKQNVNKLESEDENFSKNSGTLGTSSHSPIVDENQDIFKQQNQHLENRLAICHENLTVEKQTSSQNLRNLWKKDKELSDANLDKRIALREAKTAYEKIKCLEEDKQNLTSQFEKKHQKAMNEYKKLLTELEDIKQSLAQVSKESSSHKLQANSAQRALTQANEQIEELQTSSLNLQRELEETRKEKQTYHDQVDALKPINTRLIFSIANYREKKRLLNEKVAKLEQKVKYYNENIDSLKNNSKVLEAKLIEYENLTADYEVRENISIHENKKLQKDFHIVEQKLKEIEVNQNGEKNELLAATLTIEKLISDIKDIKNERNDLCNERDQYKNLNQEFSNHVSGLTLKVNEMECENAKLQKALNAFKSESIVVKEESSNYLTRMHELKDINQDLMVDMQSSIDQVQVLKEKIAKLESILEETRNFYKKNELEAEETRQRQEELIEYLQLKLQAFSDKKKPVRRRLF